jgi:hypothetical protein
MLIELNTMDIFEITIFVFWPKLIVMLVKPCFVLRITLKLR